MDRLEEILAKPKLPKVVARHLDCSEQALAEKYEQFRQRLSARRFVVPVAGVQGSGKSTLLNAIAFDTPVLPIDADETTCVPLEIAYAERPSGQAIVRYTDGREELVPAAEGDHRLRTQPPQPCEPVEGGPRDRRVEPAPPKARPSPRGPAWNR